MNHKVQYGSTLRKELGHFPIWDVGTLVAAGDYGVVDDNCFARLGNLADDFQATPVVEEGPPSAYEFATRGTLLGDVAVEGGAATATARLEVSFDAAYSLCIRAPDSIVSSIRNIAEVVQQLKNATSRATGLTWNRRHCFVASVRKTPCLTLLMNTSRKSSIVLKADAGLLSLLHGNKLLGEAKIDVTGDAGLKSIGMAGGVYVDLVKTRFLGGGATFLGATEDESREYERLDPNMDIIG